MTKTLILMAAASLLISGCDDLSKKPNSGTNDESTDLTKGFPEIKADTVALASIPKYTTYQNATSGEKSTAKFKDSNSTKLRILLDPESNTCSAPTRIAELTSGGKLKIYKFDQNMAASASAMGFTGTIGKNELLLVQDFVRFKMSQCDGSAKKVGIGLRCFIHVTSFKGKLAYASPPGIAASVQLDRAKASYELSTLGFAVDGRLLASGLDAQGEYNVENFGKLAVTFNKVLENLNADNPMQIDPVVLPE
ncbi:MAG: hypothetical protein ACRYG7_54595 [Janthinobacterium lividum]